MCLPASSADKVMERANMKQMNYDRAKIGNGWPGVPSTESEK